MGAIVTTKIPTRCLTLTPREAAAFADAGSAMPPSLLVRPLKPQPSGWLDPQERAAVDPDGWQSNEHSGVWSEGGCADNGPECRCPWGVPGTRLACRETWGAVWPDGCDDGRVYLADTELAEENWKEWEFGRPIRLDECRIEYRADLSPGCTDWPGGWPEGTGDDHGNNPWRSAATMPASLARTHLRLISVRVVRLSDVSAPVVLAAGLTSKWLPSDWGWLLNVAPWQDGEVKAAS